MACTYWPLTGSGLHLLFRNDVGHPPWTHRSMIAMLLPANQSRARSVGDDPDVLWIPPTELLAISRHTESSMALLISLIDFDCRAAGLWSRSLDAYASPTYYGVCSLDGVGNQLLYAVRRQMQQIRNAGSTYKVLITSNVPHLSSPFKPPSSHTYRHPLIRS